LTSILVGEQQTKILFLSIYISSAYRTAWRSNAVNRPTIVSLAINVLNQ